MTTDLTDAEAARLEGLLFEATPGEWSFRKDDLGCKEIGAFINAGGVRRHFSEIACTVGLSDEDRDRANADLIARAVNALPALLAERRALKARVADAIAALEQCAAPRSSDPIPLDKMTAEHAARFYATVCGERQKIAAKALARLGAPSAGGEHG